VHEARYDLVMDLVEERAASIVAFNYTHERDYLIEQAEKRKISYGVIDGSVPTKMRTEIVEGMQSGALRVVFGQPASMSHGLTLTRAKTVIWCSPTYNAEHYVQFNARIYRKGQNEKTEIIRIAAKDTWEPHVYKKLGVKVENMEQLLSLLKTENEDA
jgi:SNF2 family DNA or RNA helicase